MGVREGLLTGIEVSLELKFGEAGLQLLPEVYKPALSSRRRIEGIEDVDVLRAVQQAIRSASTPEDLRRIYRSEQWTVNSQCHTNCPLKYHEFW